MTNFTRANLLDVENMAAGREDGLGEFEARFARSAIESEHLGISYFSAPPNFRIPFGHSHREQEEAYVVVSGSGRMRLQDEVIELKQWDVVRVAPTVVRAYESGPEGLVLIAVGNDRPEGGDGEMVKDFWTD